jgi:hypothetical protein
MYRDNGSRENEYQYFSTAFTDIDKANECISTNRHLDQTNKAGRLKLDTIEIPDFDAGSTDAMFYVHAIFSDEYLRNNENKSGRVYVSNLYPSIEHAKQDTIWKEIESLYNQHPDHFFVNPSHDLIQTHFWKGATPGCFVAIRYMKVC